MLLWSQAVVSGLTRLCCCGPRLWCPVSLDWAAVVSGTGDDDSGAAIVYLPYRPRLALRSIVCRGRAAGSHIGGGPGRARVDRARAGRAGRGGGVETSIALSQKLLCQSTKDLLRNVTMNVKILFLAVLSIFVEVTVAVNSAGNPVN